MSQIIESPDGDPKRRGKVGAKVKIGTAMRVSPKPPPRDHPVWQSVIVTPDDVRRSVGSDLVIARDMDDALRRARD